jgi:hypothetical protein
MNKLETKQTTTSCADGCVEEWNSCSTSTSRDARWPASAVLYCEQELQHHRTGLVNSGTGAFRHHVPGGTAGTVRARRPDDVDVRSCESRTRAARKHVSDKTLEREDGPPVLEDPLIFAALRRHAGARDGAVKCDRGLPLTSPP